MKIRVLLADDHTVVRHGLRLVIENSGDMEIVAEAENGRDAVQLARKLAPDVIVLDVLMPGLNGLQAARQLKTAAPSSRILVLSSYSDEESLREMVAAGVNGYLAKETAANELLQAIRETRRGNPYFSSRISRSLFEQDRNAVRTNRITLKERANLTPRETEVLKLIADGMPNKGIAVELGISIKTVEKHRQQVMNKLNIHEVAGLTRHAVATRMTERRPVPAVSPAI
jgi:DNA-binding NarL/FixJ family response regulator